ncbi:MAG: response regulator [Actinobacteria bacterium]|nr:response regulator [Actinomycetota bacterium]
MNKKDEPLRILIVEDDKDFASMLKLFFSSKFEAETVFAEDCLSARYALSTSEFDLITLDYQLPDGNGLDILEEVTGVEGHAPVIMVTGQGDEETAAKAIELNAEGYVVKDARLRVLLTGAVKKTLEKDSYRRALRKSEKHYRELIELANSIVLKMDGAGNLVFMNKYGFDFFGYTEEEVIGKNVVGTIVPEVESTGRGLSSMINEVVSDPDAYRSNFNENMLKSGKRVWILWANRSIMDESGNMSGTLSIGNDVTELLSTAARVERLRRLYGLVVGIVNKLTMAKKPLELYEEACRTVVEGGLLEAALIGILDKEAGTVAPVASEGCDSNFIEVISSTSDDGDATGFIFTDEAVCERRTVVCKDITPGTTMELWRKEAIKRGYRSCAAFPLLGEERVIGVFGLFANTTGLFEREVVGLFESMARYISFFTESYECKKEHEQMIESRGSRP